MDMDITVVSELYPDWRSLPDHIIGTIFSYLCEQDRYYASLVCRSWRRGFSYPESWRRFTLNISRMRKRHHRSRKKCYQSTDSLPLSMLNVVARRVRCLDVYCPLASDDKSGSMGVSLRLHGALGDMRYRGCQLHTLSLHKFDRMLTSWRDSRARLRMVKALKRFINSQQNLAVLDLKYSRFYPRELLMLLRAATYMSASAVTSINLKASYCNIVFPDAEDQAFHHDNHQRNWPIHLGELLSRFTCLRDLHLLLDVNVLQMDLLDHLPSTFRLLYFYARRSDIETEEFNNALNGNPICDSNKWSSLTKRCPLLGVVIDTRNIASYHPIYCILQHNVPLKKLRVFSARALNNSLEIIGFFHHVSELFANSLEDVCILVKSPLDGVISKLYKNCRWLKSLNLQCSLGQPEVLQDFFLSLSSGEIRISQVQLTIETTSKVQFNRFNYMKSEFMNLVIKEEGIYKKENHETHLWLREKPIQTIKFWVMGIIRSFRV